MLKHLHISNFAIVPSLELDFLPGFTAVTGETGAGKSILIDALGLLLGERSDANWVRPGEERAELTAEFDIGGNVAAQAWLTDADLEAGERCLLRRTINNSGRSRAFINGSPVTVAQLQTLGGLLVEIHGQNEHLQLTSAAALFRLLDDSGDYRDELDAVGKRHAEWKAAQDELDTLEGQTAVPAAELEFLKFQLDELGQFDLGTEAIAELQTEHERLAAGDALLDAVSDSMERLDPESGGDADGVHGGLNQVLAKLRSFEHLDKDIAASCQMLAEASVNTIEAVTALRAARERIDIDPARFAAVDDSLARLSGLARKHGVAMESLAAVRDALAARVEAAGSAAERRDEVETCLRVEPRLNVESVADVGRQHGRCLGRGFQGRRHARRGPGAQGSDGVGAGLGRGEGGDAGLGEPRDGLGRMGDDEGGDGLVRVRIAGDGLGGELGMELRR